MSLVDILTNPPDLVFYMATLIAFILSIVLVGYVCEEKRCSNAMKTYYLVISEILALLFLVIILGPYVDVKLRFPSYVLIIPVLFFIIHIIIVVIHAIYAFYARRKSVEGIETVFMLGGLLVFLGVCVIIMGSYILNLSVSQAGNFPVTGYYTTNETVAPPVTTITLTTTVTVTQSPITYTITSMVTKTEIVTSTVPESTLTITLRPLFSEDLVALAVAATMMIASIAIGLKLRKK
jgi:hypothetical protein